MEVFAFRKRAATKAEGTIGNLTDVGVLGVMTGAGFSSDWTNRPRIPDFSKTIFAGVVEAAAADAELSRHQMGR